MKLRITVNKSEENWLCYSVSKLSQIKKPVD
jgi:hypothetical protein